MHLGPWRGPALSPHTAEPWARLNVPLDPVTARIAMRYSPGRSWRSWKEAPSRNRKGSPGPSLRGLGMEDRAWLGAPLLALHGSMLGGLCGVCDPASHRAAPRGDTGQDLGSSSLNRAPWDKPLRLGGPWRLLGLQKERCRPALPGPQASPTLEATGGRQVRRWGLCARSRQQAQRKTRGGGGQGPTRACGAGAPGPPRGLGPSGRGWCPVPARARKHPC